MKWIKIIVILGIIIVITFFAFYRSKEINLEGSWDTEKMVLGGEQFFPDSISKYFHLKPQVTISSWGNSITFPKGKKDVVATYKIEKKEGNQYKIELRSSDKFLNGVFQLSIDTLILGPRAYRVNLLLHSGKTQIKLQREVHIKPVEPEFPSEGQV